MSVGTGAWDLLPVGSKCGSSDQARCPEASEASELPSLEAAEPSRGHHVSRGNRGALSSEEGTSLTGWNSFSTGGQ